MWIVNENAKTIGVGEKVTWKRRGLMLAQVIINTRQNDRLLAGSDTRGIRSNWRRSGPPRVT